MDTKDLSPGTRVVITRQEKRYGEIESVLFGRIATIQGRYWGDHRGTSYRVIVDGLSGDDWSLWSDDIEGVLCCLCPQRCTKEGKLHMADEHTERTPTYITNEELITERIVKMERQVAFLSELTELLLRRVSELQDKQQQKRTAQEITPWTPRA